MHWILRGLAALSASLALVITIGAVAAPARADDSKSSTPRVVVKGDPYRHLGAKTAKQLKAAESINRHATGPKRKVLDYRLADKYDRGQTKARRQFAASWLWVGKKVKNISAKERKIVKSYVKKYFGKRKPPKASTSLDQRVDRRDYCRGKGGFESLGGGEWNAYFSSCSTAIMIAELQFGGLLVGYIATKMGPYAPVGLIAAGLMEVGAIWITVLRDLSPDNAIWIMRRMIGPKTSRQQVLTMLPQ